MADSRSYTNRDYETITEDLDRKIKEQFPNDWTDFYAGNLGVALKELIAHDFDILSFVVDKRARETYVTTAELRESIIHLANGVGYKISPATGSSIDLDLSLASERAYDTIIEKGTTVKNVDDLIFELPADAIILAGNLTFEEYVIEQTPFLTLSVENNSSNITFNQVLPEQIRIGHYIKPVGSTKSFQISFISSDRLSGTFRNVFTDASVSEVSYNTLNQQLTFNQGETKKEYFTSSGEQNQSFQLETFPVLSGTVKISIGGFFWIETDSLVQELDTSVYEVRHDENDAPIISFGDNVTGKIPPTDSEIVVYARVGIGKEGNIARSTFNTTIRGSSGGQPVQIYVTNPATEGSGGADRASVEEVKRAIPAYIKTSDNAVTSEDYNTLSTGYTDPDYGKIVKAVASLSSNIIPLESNLVKIYAWTEDSEGVLTSPSDSLRVSLKNYLDERKLVGTEILILNGLSKDIDVSVSTDLDVTLNRDLIKVQIKSGITDVFTDPTIEPGSSLFVSKLYEAVETIEGVESAFITTSPEMVNGEIATAKFEMIKLGVITILEEPPAPVFLSVPLTSSDGGVVLHWGFVTEAIEYSVEISEELSFLASTVIYTGSATNASISGLVNGAYHFRIRSHNNAGYSEYKEGTNPLHVTIS